MSAHGREVAFSVFIPKPLSLVLVALVAIVVAFGMYTIVTGVADVFGGKRTSWRLAGPTTGTELQIGVYVGGCDEFKRTSVSEDDEEVVIKAYIRQGIRGADDICPDILNSELKTVQLKAPLGSRALRGCNPESAVHRSDGSPDRDCVAETKINESPAMRELTDLLFEVVRASYQPSSGRHLSEVGIGIREPDDGQVYIEVELRGVDVTALREEIPNEIAGYKVRLLQLPPTP